MSTQTSVGSPQTSSTPSLRADFVAGAQVALIALPLGLGIAMASGFPPVAGILTAIVGGICGTLLSNSALTIKGPAAGLIVIVFGAVQELGQGNTALGYRLTLGIGVVAGMLQIGLALLRTGVFGDFFPSAAVHGMLAAIGVIIIGKQTHTLLGVVPNAQSPLGLIAEIPNSVMNLNPEVAAIGALSLLVLVGLPKLAPHLVRRLPLPMVVLIIAIPLGVTFDLSHEHVYTLWHHQYLVGKAFLVRLPAHLASALTLPSFAAVLTPVGLKYVVMLTLVGSLESLLSAKAIDELDPHRRRTDLNRDLLAVGVGNMLASSIGGLPMISEIVRSTANLQSGARSRMANLFHGLVLLACVALLPTLLQRIPLAALAAMLVSVGLRLASPHEFASLYRIGREQLLVFVITLVATLATDLLLGVFIGVVVSMLLNLLDGVPLRSLFPARVQVAHASDRVVISVQEAAVFSNWLSLRQRVLHEATVVKKGGNPSPQEVHLDVSQACCVDHTVMTKLSQLKEDLAQRGQHLIVTGLEKLHALSAHPLAGRRRSHKRVEQTGPLV